MTRTLASTRWVLALAAVGGFAVAGCAGGFAPQGSPAATDTGALGCQIAPPPGAIVRTGDPRAPGQPMAGIDVRVMTPRQVGELARSRGLKVTWRYEYGITAGVGPGGVPLTGSTPAATPVAPAQASSSTSPPPSLAPSAPLSPSDAASPSAPLSPSAADWPKHASADSPKPGGVAFGVGSSGFSECWCEPPPDGRVTDLAYGMASELIVFVDSGKTLAAPREQPQRGWGC